MKDETTSHGVSRELTEELTCVVPPQLSGESRAARLRATLIVLSGGEIGREIDVTDTPRILGRAGTNDACINAPSVSRQHARIDRLVEDGQDCFQITDLASSNGTLVNNRRIVSSLLRDGDKVSMGDVLFKFVLQDAIDAQFHQEVHRLIHYDQLTGLLKMDAFRRRLDALVRQRERSRPMTLAMTDLDGLKRVNDTFGHLAGRMVVREMGAMMRQALRPEDVAALYGGDEAIILFPDATIETAAQVAGQLAAIVRGRVFEHGNHTFGVTISQGLAEWPRHGGTAEELIAAADRALYAAKHAGRDCVRSADEVTA